MATMVPIKRVDHDDRDERRLVLVFNPWVSLWNGNGNFFFVFNVDGNVDWLKVDVDAVDDGDDAHIGDAENVAAAAYDDDSKVKSNKENAAAVGKRNANFLSMINY